MADLDLESEDSDGASDAMIFTPELANLKKKELGQEVSDESMDEDAEKGSDDDEPKVAYP